MLLKLLHNNSDIIKDVVIQNFRKEKSSYELIATLYLHDESLIHIREYLFSTGRRKYVYHWQRNNGKLLGRWDNAPHWPSVNTFPDHFHDGHSKNVVASQIKEIHDVIMYIRSLKVDRESG